jgi:hypothetical protein
MLSYHMASGYSYKQAHRDIQDFRIFHIAGRPAALKA